MDADLMDQSLGAVCNALYHIILARIVHRCEHADVAFHIQSESVILNSVLVQDLLSHFGIDTAFSDFLKILVDDVRTAAGDVEIRLHKSCDEGCQASHLSAGAKAEKVTRLLVLADLLHVLRGQFAVIFRFIKIQRAVEITCEYFLHYYYPRCPVQTTKSSLTDAFSFQILTCTSPHAV